MLEESTEPSSSASAGAILLRPRREPFEHGLLPISKLIFSDAIIILGPLKEKLLLASPTARIKAPELADALQIPPEYARLALDTLASVLPVDSGPDDGVDVHDLILFLYLQTYKRLLPRVHKDSPAVADVWPSTSAFDGYLSALSPLQLVRSNNRRFIPSQADEEAHQLSYLQKHMANILALLAEAGEGEGDESLVLTSERLEHLGFLIQFVDSGCEGIALSQAAPFFANSDPDMPAAPVPASQVHDWLLQHIGAALEKNAEKALAKENGHANDSDVTMADACVNQMRAQTGSSLIGTSVHNNAYFRNQTFVEGFSKASVIKESCDIKGHSVKVMAK